MWISLSSCLAHNTMLSFLLFIWWSKESRSLQCTCILTEFKVFFFYFEGEYEMVFLFCFLLSVLSAWKSPPFRASVDRPSSLFWTGINQAGVELPVTSAPHSENVSSRQTGQLGQLESVNSGVTERHPASINKSLGSACTHASTPLNTLLYSCKHMCAH